MRALPVPYLWSWRCLGLLVKVDLDSPIVLKRRKSKRQAKQIGLSDKGTIKGSHFTSTNKQAIARLKQQYFRHFRSAIGRYPGEHKVEHMQCFIKARQECNDPNGRFKLLHFARQFSGMTSPVWCIMTYVNRQFWFSG